MDQERSRIQADLQGLLEGEIRCDDLFCQMYASDASLYEILPLGVVRPRHTADVVAVVQYAQENSIPVIARGAGTGISGESVGRGLVVDFSAHMRRTLQINSDTVRVQPGVILSRLNRQLSAVGRCFGPDPATRSVSTMGSVLAIDASGSHWMQYGTARDKVVSMEVVLPDGKVITARKQSLTDYGQEDPAHELAVRVQNIVGRNSELIQKHRPQTKVARSGYFLDGIIEDSHIDLAKLIVGSEGTLGLITEATVLTDPLPIARGVTLFFFDRLEKAAQAALEISKLGAVACDLMDRRLLSIARENDRRYSELIPVEAEAMLLVEFSEDDIATVRERIQIATNRIQRRKRLAFDVRTTTEQDERNFYWRLARRVIPRLYRLDGNERPLPFVEDVVVPPEKLASFLTQAQKIWQKHQITASLFAHAAHGQIHWRPFLDMSSGDETRRMQEVADELYQAVMDVGGMVGGEHGDGLSRTWFLRKQFGDLYPVFRDIKRVFDPTGILNPGKIVADNAQPLTKNFRRVSLIESKTDGAKTEDEAFADDSVSDVGEDEEVEGDGRLPERTSLPVLNLNWNHTQLMHETRSCNGCGRCRTTSSSERMCPIFRLAPTEEATPRAKANLLRAVLNGQISADAMRTSEFKEIADLCVNCHQCRLECPAGVDIPKMMIEAKSQFVDNNGLKPSESLMARVDMILQNGQSV